MESKEAQAGRCGVFGRGIFYILENNGGVGTEFATGGSCVAVRRIFKIP